MIFTRSTSFKVGKQLRNYRQSRQHQRFNTERDRSRRALEYSHKLHHLTGKLDGGNKGRGYVGTITGVSAEQHTIRFQNNCGKGTPQLVQNGNILSTGQDYVSNGPFTAGIAYLQTGECLLNGEGCTLLEMTLVNPTAPGSGSSTDISLIPPHAFNVEASFSYFDGCDGAGATCSSSTCPTAFFQPNDNQVQVQCQTDNVNLLISFCSPASLAAGMLRQLPALALSTKPIVDTMLASPLPSLFLSSAPLVAHWLWLLCSWSGGFAYEAT
ncbi:hypothetical protein A0H81_11971 [Grifola frondosa]|uniref:Uncharacterized protein n=1 Tax=Grifola frondosa TaxID=5627 RepID=A0A1C7LUV9_GRIFR|nr:hypothetical protein A0H81_11971 [Grifola frondosa]